MTDSEKEKNLVRYEGDRAAGWVKWFHITETSAQPVSDRMVALANIGPGDRVLDIATGLGEPALTAAKAAGPTGHVLATDLSQDMMDFAAKRAGNLGLANVDFRVMDANALDLEPASFDAVLSRWGLMFLTELDAALDAIHRCLKPGGRLVAVVWGPGDGAPTNSLADRVLRKTLGMAPPEEGPLTPFALQDTDAFMERVRKAGFADVTSEWIEVLLEFKSPAEFAEYRRDRAGGIKKHLADLSAAEQDAAWDAVAKAAERFVESDGVCRMRNRAFCLVAQR
jgi:ubiquinone/menaquinone biosynthesis C-methylase UbiE